MKCSLKQAQLQGDILSHPTLCPLPTQWITRTLRNKFYFLTTLVCHLHLQTGFAQQPQSMAQYNQGGQGKYNLTLLQNCHYLHSTLKVVSFTKLCNCYEESKIQGILSFATLRSNWNPTFLQAQVCHFQKK